MRREGFAEMYFTLWAVSETYLFSFGVGESLVS